MTGFLFIDISDPKYDVTEWNCTEYYILFLKINSTSGLTDTSILDFHHQQQVITSPGTLP